MSQTRLLLFAFASWACSLLLGEVRAQAPSPGTSAKSFAPAQTGQKVENFNARRTRPGSAPSQLPETDPLSQSQTAQTYVAVIGAVNQPAVFETSQRSLPLGQLIEKAGGMSADSYGGVSMLDMSRAQTIEPVARSLNLPVGNGQIAYLVPRGGNSPTQLLGSRAAPVNKKILITGLTNGPRLLRVDNQRPKLGDFLVSLGQSVEMYERRDVIAFHPQVGTMDLDSELIANSVIHFIPTAVNQVGLHDACLRGFRLEQPVHVDGPPAGPSRVPTAAQPTPARAAAPSPLSANRPSDLDPSSSPQGNVPTPPGTSSLIPQTLSPSGDPSGIEAAGSSTFSREPLPFPRNTDTHQDPTPQGPYTKGDGRLPLMLPKSWGASDGTSTDRDPDEKSERIIERTSAGHHRNNHRVVTASASTVSTESPARPAKPASGLGLAEIESEAQADGEGETASLVSGPQSWMILVLVTGIVGASVVVSRLISRPDFAARTTRQLHDGPPKSPTPPPTFKPVQSPTVAPQPVAVAPSVMTASAAPAKQTVVSAKTTPVSPVAPVEEPTTEEEHRFLQRLIMNKVTVVEEEPALPQIDHLHGSTVGASRMIVHEAHETIAGPHFRVRNPGDSRELELRLRQLLRTDRPKKRDVVVHAGEVRDPRETSSSPLERALRSVDRGGTQ